MQRKSGKKPKLTKNLGSFAFFLGIPLTFLVGTLFLLVLTNDIRLSGFTQTHWLLFTSGAILGAALLSVFHLTWLRVFLHEIKHGAVVLISGNKLKDIEIEGETGFLEYETDKSRDQFDPYIILAPYFFPLLSLPVFIVALIVGSAYAEPFAVLLGVAITIDMISSIAELYPHQSDLHRVFGGMPIAVVFIVGAHYLWILTCLLWLQCGLEGFSLAAYVAVKLTTKSFG